MTWRRAITFGLVVLFVAILIPQWMEIRNVTGVLQHGRPLWLLVALLLQLLWFLNQAALYQSIYALLDLPASVPHLLPIVLASNFVNFATPTASMGAVPLFLDDAGQRNLDRARVTLTNLLRLLLNLVWFSIPLSFSLVVLYRGNMLRSYHLIAATILLATALVMVTMLVVAGTRQEALIRGLTSLVQRLNRIWQALRQRDLLSAARARDFARHFGVAATVLWQRRRRLLRPLLHSMALDGLEVGVLFAVFKAFPNPDHDLSLVHLVTGYSIGVLFSVVAITPQGLGVVEGALVAAFSMLGVDMGRAAVVMLAYRVMSFWLPLLVGFAALRLVRGIGKPVATSEEVVPAIDPGFVETVNH